MLILFCLLIIGLKAIYQAHLKELIMNSIIIIAVAIFILVLAILAIYLLTHLHKAFLIFNPDATPRIRTAMIVTSILLLATCVGGVLILILMPAKWNLITLIVGSVVTAGFALAINFSNS